ncbi:PDZ domain-containing protein [Candidatus Sumerlaeota bacterium]|nr:PDZ domain-containing protein [Candidatus Sumerlaeota bacterium]
MKWKSFSVLFAVMLAACFSLASDSPQKANCPLLPSSAFETARKAFVRVEIYFKKAERPEEMEIDEGESDGPSASVYVENKSSRDFSGVIFNEKGDILIPEFRMDDAVIDYIEAISWNGERKKCRIKALLVDAPAMILEPDGEPHKSLLMPLYVPAPSPETEPFQVIGLFYAKPRWELQSSFNLNQSALFEKEKAAPFQYSSFPYATAKQGIKMVFNSGGEPIGLDITTAFEPDEASGLWKGESLSSAQMILYGDYRKLQKEWATAYAGIMHEVKIEFRKKSKSDSGMSGFFGRMLSAAEDKAETSLQEMKGYGPAIDPKTIFIPNAPNQARAKLIDDITITVGEKKLKGRFLGAFRDFDGFLVELVDGEFPQIADLTKAGTIPRIKLFYALRVSEKHSAKNIRILFNRWLEDYKGYNNTYHWTPQYPIQDGDFILDANGRLAGMWLRLRKEGEEIRKAAQAESYNFMGREYFELDWDLARSENKVFFSAAYLKDVFSSPEDYWDPNIKVLAEKDEDFRFWLGVEFDAINKDLAKSLKVEKPTMDGSIGLIVSTVYEDSPAARLGIKQGDILLRIKPEGNVESLDLVLSREEYDFDFDEGDIPPQLQSMGFKMPEKHPWRTQKNYLNNLLETIGEGKKISLTYLHDQEEKTVDLIVEKAPVDFENAPKFKDKDLGLTVKDVTYEVRRSLDMKKDAPGVVIAKVEDGSPAAIARLNLYEIIAQVDGKPVNDSEEFGKAIDAAREKKLVTIQIQVISLDKSRFADLQLKITGESNP